MGTEPQGRILVLGVGNLLMGDEGVGIHAVHELEKRGLPRDVDIVDGATAGPDLLPLMRRYDSVLIIDAVDGGQEPGTILRFAPEDVSSDTEGLALSLHQAEILKVLEMAAYLGQPLPPVVIFGIQPQAMDWSTELSPTVKARLETLLSAVVDEVTRMLQ